MTLSGALSLTRRNGESSRTFRVVRSRGSEENYEEKSSEHHGGGIQ